jgi:hypothetical protein
MSPRRALALELEELLLQRVDLLDERLGRLFRLLECWSPA